MALEELVCLEELQVFSVEGDQLIQALESAVETDVMVCSVGWNGLDYELMVVWIQSLA